MTPPGEEGVELDLTSGIETLRLKLRAVEAERDRKQEWIDEYNRTLQKKIMELAQAEQRGAAVEAEREAAKDRAVSHFIGVNQSMDILVQERTAALDRLAQAEQRVAGLEAALKDVNECSPWPPAPDYTAWTAWRVKHAAALTPPPPAP